MKFAVTVVIIAVVKAVFSTGDHSGRQTIDYALPATQPRQSYAAPEPPVVQSPPKARQHLTIDQILALYGEALKRRPDLGMSVSEFSRYMQAKQLDYDFTEGIAYSAPAIPPQSESVSPQIASTPVLDQPPAPEKSRPPTGETVATPKPAESSRRSEVALGNTREFVSSTLSSHKRDFFTVGSTKDEVLAVQGSPSRLTDSSFHYGTADVFFENDHVKSWYDGFPKLKAKLLPSAQVEPKDFFTVGSTKDEVLALQGTPSRFTDSSLHYGTSDVFFENGRVKSWYDGFPKLKARLLAVSQTATRP